MIPSFSRKIFDPAASFRAVGAVIGAKFLGALAIVLLFAPSALAQVPGAFERPLKVCAALAAEGIPSNLRASDNEVTFYLTNASRRLGLYSTSGLRNLWAIEPGGRLASIPYKIPDSNRIAVLTETPDAFVLRFFDDASGIARGSLRFEKTTFAGALLRSDSLLLADRSGALQRVAIPDGRVIWRVPFQEPDLDGSVIGNGHAAFGAGENFVVLDLASGEEVLRVSRKAVGKILGMAGPDTILAAGVNGEILAFEYGSEKPSWKYRTGGAATSAVAIGDSALVGSTDNFIYRINVKRGSVEWKTRLADRVLTAPIIAGGVFFVANELRNTAEVYDLDDGRIINRFVVSDGRRIVALVPAGTTGRMIIVTAGNLYEVASDCGK